ncbi:FAD-binding monooxygenase [Rhodococcoides trifolii]|uniref:FAD-binding monooxygenase n=1 Tax=Rhodococcoides trifolii TaxID=908250 RepID=A0A917FQW7_9NOCA|nr:FAD-dependent monooxygenase [Rhodococcus trifolii]GGF98374.1 FAD-binding monooxygenase [Rhodococcus trifolii]
MSPRTVLVSGASVAGPTLAYWLERSGVSTTVIERFPELRSGGQSVDLRGAGRTVVQRMGIEDAVRAAGTGETGLQFVDSRGKIKAQFGSDTMDGEGPTAELEILRGDLGKILYDHTRDRTEYVFGDSITGIDDDGDRVRVSFEHSADRDFDIVVLAEGLRSRTRSMVFGDDVSIRDLGMYTSYFTIPRVESDTQWAQWSNAPGSRSVLLRPDNVGTTRATLSFMTDPKGYETLTVDDQKDVLRRTFSDAPFAARALAGLTDTPDFYFESLGQVTMSTWSKGRVVLLGDAGYCASPISGMGTSLATVGAYVLAGEIASHDDHRDAFTAYESIMRPYVDQAQKLASGAPRVANPKTKLGVATMNAVLGLASRIKITSLFGKFASPPSDKIDLPNYAVPIT